MTDATKTLSGTDILSADDRTIRPVDVPEWGGRVFVRSMMGDERDEFELAAVAAAGADDDEKAYLRRYRARLVAATCCDESGRLLFTPAQVAALGQKNGTALTRVVRVAQELNHMGPHGVEDAKKNSAAGPSAGSPSDSPSPSGSGT